MADRPLSCVSPISFLQTFVTQSIKLLPQLGCASCEGQQSHIGYLGLTASGCFEDAYRQEKGLEGPLSLDQYADAIVTIKNQIGGNFSRAASGPDSVRVINTRCPFGDAVKDAPELCRMTSSVFGGIAARNFGYAKVELKRRLAANDGMCEVCIYTSTSSAKDRPGDEYRSEAGAIVSEADSAQVAARVEEKIQKVWCQGSPAAQTVEAAYRGPRIVAESKAMRRVLESIEIVAPTMATVLITGETGVGKEVVARAVHALSDRWEHEFVALNCGAIPESLIESLLFGHERGAFTGAYDVHHGVFERAEQGTLFLDEIDSLPLGAQARLLRVLQEGEFERIGGRQGLRADVRVLAATNHRMDDLVSSGRFRRDLYYRLNVVPILIPPLRERTEDISPLANYFLRRLAEKYHTKPRVLGERAWRQLMTYAWPGNVRELENVCERSFLFTQGHVIAEVLLDVRDEAGRQNRAEGKAPPLKDLKKRAAMELEGKLVRDMLMQFHGNVSAAARCMGITPRAVHQKLRAHGIDASNFRRQRRSTGEP